MDRRTNSEGEDIIYDIIRGEVGVAGGEPCAGEDDHREDVVDEDEISSFLNASGDGLELEQVDEGQTNNDDEGQTNNDDGPSTTTGEVYIY
jgi:hypothetical protein